MPNSEGEKLHEPITARRDRPCPARGLPPLQVPPPLPATGGSVPTWGSSTAPEPLTGSTGAIPAAEQLAAFMRALVLSVR